MAIIFGIILSLSISVSFLSFYSLSLSLFSFFFISLSLSSSFFISISFFLFSQKFAFFLSPFLSLSFSFFLSLHVSSLYLFLLFPLSLSLSLSLSVSCFTTFEVMMTYLLSELVKLVKPLIRPRRCIFDIKHYFTTPLFLP